MTIRASLAASTMLLLLAACSGATGDVPANPTPSSSSPPSGAPSQNKSGDDGAPAADSTSLDLGRVAPGSMVHFDVPAGVRGFTILVDGSITADDSIGVQELRDPSGALVVSEFLDVSHPARLLAGSNGVDIAAVTVPLIDDRAGRPVPAGRWTVRLGGSTRVPNAPKGTSTPLSGPQLHGAVRLQLTHDGAFHGGAMDLDLYVPEGLQVGGKSGQHAVYAASAGSDPEMKARLDVVFELFQRLYGIGRGDVRFHAAPASLVSVSGDQEIDAANVLANARNTRPAAQVVLTNRLSPDGNGEISGISNCLPGAVGVPSTTCSAVIVSLREGAPAWQDAATMVHEIGHFVGLAHTTEFEGDGDTLADTPLCTDTSKSALDSCPDHDNLMFPSVSSATSEAALTVSEAQRAIFRSSPIYRATR